MWLHKYGFLCISSSCRSKKSCKQVVYLQVDLSSPDTSHLVSVAKGLHRFTTLPFGVGKGWEDELICNDMLHYSFFASAIKLIVGFPMFKPSVATMHIHTNIQDTEETLSMGCISRRPIRKSAPAQMDHRYPPPVPSESELTSFNL